MECIEAANATASPQRKAVFLELAQRWLDLASRMDAISLRGNALLYHPMQTRHWGSLSIAPPGNSQRT
jgi:hypothetical protein